MKARSEILMVLALLLSCPKAFAQAPDIIWKNLVSTNDDDIGTDICQVSAINYMVAGSSQLAPGAHGMYDFWLVKIDTANVLWSKGYGGSGSDLLAAMILANDNGYVLAGYTTSSDGDVTNYHGNGLSPDCWVVKTDDTGKLVWQKTLGGTATDVAMDMISTKNGYLVAASTHSNDGDVTGKHMDEDIWIVKLDNTGNIVWQKCYGGSKWEWPYSIINTSDGGYMVAGMTVSQDGDVNSSHGKEDAWLIKLDDTGAIVWQKTYGGSKTDYAYSVKEAKDGGYIFVGRTDSDDGDVTNHKDTSDAWIVKVDNSGAIVWQKDLGGSQRDNARDISLTEDGYIVAASTMSSDGDVQGNNHGLEDYWIIKLDTTGDIQWQKLLGGSGNDYCSQVLYDLKGGYTIAGGTSSYDGDISNPKVTREDIWIAGLSQFPLHVQEAPVSRPIVYPTFSNGVINIETHANEKLSLSLLNALGQPVAFKQEMETGKTILSVNNPVPGQYYLLVTASGTTTGYKLFLY